MSGVHRLAIVEVVVVGGVTALAIVNWNRLIERIGPPFESTQEARGLSDSLHDPVVLTEPPTNVREVERSRRAERPADDLNRKYGLDYDSVLAGRNHDGTPPCPKPAGPMPPTSCRSVERAPKHESNVSGPYRVHDLTVSMFESASGFGLVRMALYENGRGVHVPSRAVDRVELVSLLTDDEPSVYVLDEMATPALARQAKRRPLDEFERLGLDAVRRGEQLVWTREAPTRMFGAIRARAYCLECHAHAKKGDLLGAFTYYLDTPIDRLAERREAE
jgi:hypothetical protein